MVKVEIEDVQSADLFTAARPNDSLKFNYEFF